MKRVHGGAQRLRTAADLAAPSCVSTAARLAAGGESVSKYITCTAHREALIVRGTDYDVGHLDQPWASLSVSDDFHLNVISSSYDRICVCAHVQWRWARNDRPDAPRARRAPPPRPRCRAAAPARRRGA